MKSSGRNTALLCIGIVVTATASGYAFFLHQFAVHFGDGYHSPPPSPMDQMEMFLALTLGFPGTWLLQTRTNLGAQLVIHVIVQSVLAYLLVSFLRKLKPFIDARFGP